jgi:hypothetical protein
VYVRSHYRNGYPVGAYYRRDFGSGLNGNGFLLIILVVGLAPISIPLLIGFGVVISIGQGLMGAFSRTLRDGPIQMQSVPVKPIPIEDLQSIGSSFGHTWSVKGTCQFCGISQTATAHFGWRCKVNESHFDEAEGEDPSFIRHRSSL